MPPHTVERTSLKSKSEEELKAHNAEQQRRRRKEEKLRRLAAIAEQRAVQASRFATNYMLQKQTQAIKKNEAAVMSHMDRVLTNPELGCSGLATLLNNGVAEVAMAAIEDVQYSVQPPTPERSAAAPRSSARSEHCFVSDAAALMPAEGVAEAQSEALVPRHDGQLVATTAAEPSTPGTAVAVLFQAVSL